MFLEHMDMSAPGCDDAGVPAMDLWVGQVPTGMLSTGGGRVRRPAHAVLCNGAGTDVPAAVREFVTWARSERRVRLVNADEVGHAGRTLPSAEAMRALRLEDTPESRAAAAALLRQEAAALFGGADLAASASAPLPHSASAQ